MEKYLLPWGVRGKSPQPSPTWREFVFFLQLLRGENELANPPVHCRALCPRGEEQVRGAELSAVGVCMKNIHKMSVHILVSTITLKIKACSSTCLLCKPLNRSVCVEIVRRHHLSHCWVSTASPLVCDTNKPGGERHTVILGVPCLLVSPSLATAWFGLASVYLGRRLLVCLAQGPRRGKQ